MALAFTKKGVYRPGTKTVEMSGVGTEVETSAPTTSCGWWSRSRAASHDGSATPTEVVRPV
jgi:hypothetical protein